jgi:hypothetical protein
MASLSSSSHAGRGTRSTFVSASTIFWIFRLFSRTSITSPGRTWYDGMLMRLPLTVKWPWRTS